MKTIKLSILVVSGFILFGLGYFTGNKLCISDNTTKDWTEVGGNIDIQYYLEASEDSIWIEDYYTKEVYGGKYSELQSMIELSNK
jgi:hypothetical protein